MCVIELGIKDSCWWYKGLNGPFIRWFIYFSPNNTANTSDFFIQDAFFSGFSRRFLSRNYYHLKKSRINFCFLLMFAKFFWTFFLHIDSRYTELTQHNTHGVEIFFPIKIIALFASFDHDSINGSKNRRSEKFFFSFCLVEKKFSDLIFFFLKSFSFENSYDDDDDEKKFLWFPGILLKFNYGIFALEILWKFCKNSVQNRMDYGWIFLLLLLLLFRLTINQSNQNQNKHSVVFCLRITSISFLIEWIFCWETFSEKVIRCNLFQTIWLMMNYGIFLFFIFFHHKSKSKTTEEFIFKEF